MAQRTSQPAPRFAQLSPFFIFIGLFSLLNILFYASPAASKSGFALFSCIVAVIFSLFTFPKKISLNEKMQVFVNGTAQPTILYMAYIFIISSVFTHVLTQNGGVTSAVNIGLSLIPAAAIVPGIFITVSLFALTIGSSMGSIAAFMPIALGFATTLGIDPALIAGIVVGGSMLGDNLSLISDTTIAAVQTTSCDMVEKFRENVRFVFPAALITLIILGIVGFVQAKALPDYVVPALTSRDFINIIPYGLVLALALAGTDVLAVLTLGTLCASLIGLAYNSFNFLQATSFLFQGFYTQPGMVNVLMLVLVIAGLAHIIEHNGGIEYLLTTFNNRITTKGTAQYAIALLVFFVNAAIAINTVAILVTGPVAKKIGDRFGISRSRVASILDVFACLCQGLAPYTPQLLLAGAMAGVSSIAIIPHLHYQFAIAGVGIILMLKTH